MARCRHDLEWDIDTLSHRAHFVVPVPVYALAMSIQDESVAVIRRWFEGQVGATTTTRRPRSTSTPPNGQTCSLIGGGPLVMVEGTTKACF